MKLDKKLKQFICSIDKLVIGIYNTPMKEKLKVKKLQVWLDSLEFNFLQNYSKINHFTVSELIRGWIHEVMKREGFEIKEPSLPESKTKNKGVK